MGKLEYLDALKRAMAGLAPAVQAKTLAYYEQRFVDGVAAGRSEQDVAAELDAPTKIAMTLRASSHLSAFEQKKNPATFVRMVVSGLGLAIFNLLMVVPAAVYFSMLLALYAVAFGFYIIGIATTASALAGANELVLNRPFGIVLSDDDDGSERNAQTHISISESGIRVFNDKPGARQDDTEAGADAADTADAADGADDAADTASRAAVVERARREAERAGSLAARAGREAERAAGVAAREAERTAAREAARAVGRENGAEADFARPRPARVLRGAEAVAGRAIRITTDLDSRSRTTQTAFGLVMVVGAILLFLLSLVLSKYTMVGLKRYFQMNLSLLKGS
ncbi:MAG: DUF1700 domain-containing protein [Massilia sp.]